MLTKIEVLNYRALRYISQELSPFQILVGANASGKSTFLDVPYFSADLLNARDISEAIRERSADFRNLTWMQSSNWLEMAIEVKIPQALAQDYQIARYEIYIEFNEKNNEALGLSENFLLLKNLPIENFSEFRSFPQLGKIPKTLMAKQTANSKTVLASILSQRTIMQSENSDWEDTFRFSSKRATLSNVPEDLERFPITSWFKNYIAEAVQRIMLNSEMLRKPSPPNSPRYFLPDGSNLPWVIHELETKHPALLEEWLALVRTALPDIQTISTIERPEDRHRYLVLEYKTGLKAPSWMISDGTLRLLALTALAFQAEQNRIYLIEEPENGIHPKAVETIFQALHGMYQSQVFLASHSPVILGLAEPKELLCFALTEKGETDIIQGQHHPGLREWRGESSLSTLFAAGVLG